MTVERRVGRSVTFTFTPVLQELRNIFDPGSRLCFSILSVMIGRRRNCTYEKSITVAPFTPIEHRKLTSRYKMQDNGRRRHQLYVQSATRVGPGTPQTAEPMFVFISQHQQDGTV